jgi:hypothetical protein
MTQLCKFLFLMFVISGFCGLLYQVVWPRPAFSHFGVITPVLSVILLVFMLGIAAGSFAAGRAIATPRMKLGPLMNIICCAVRLAYIDVAFPAEVRAWQEGLPVTGARRVRYLVCWHNAREGKLRWIW